MTSGKQARRQRQQPVQRPPTRSTGGGRKASPLVLGGVLAAIVVIATVVVAVVALGGNSSSGGSTTATVLPDADVIAKQFAGIPQHGDVLGKASAPVTMVEYIDLQCPVCRDFETNVMPSVIDRTSTHTAARRAGPAPPAPRTDGTAPAEPAPEHAR